MGGAEVVDRARQEVSKRVDTVLLSLGHDFRERPSRTRDRHARFFFDNESLPSVLYVLRNRFSEDAEDVVHRAEQAVLHRFDLLGYRGVNYGPKIDWHCDAVHVKRAPLVPFYRVPFLQHEDVGDVKVTWELNRHQHFMWLAMAYRLTAEEKFGDEIARQWRDWHAQNPYSMGVNWASSLEVALRSISWIWTLFLLEHTAAMTDAFRHEWLAALGVNGRHIERYLSTYFSPNTHLIGEAVALFFIGTLCPELPSAARWRQRGWSILLRELQRQVRADGMYFEQSTYYHVYAVDMFLHSMILASRNGIRIPVEFQTRIISMLEALAAIGATGSPPRFGDDDGGRLFDARRNGTNALLDPLRIGAAVFSRGDFKGLARTPSAETLWLLGATGIGTWDKLVSETPTTKSRALTDSGLYIMSHKGAATQLIIDAGPQGALHAGHGHADALSVCLSSNGVDLLIDPGTGEYSNVRGNRSRFRSTSAHNTLQIDERDQGSFGGLFSWESVPNVSAEMWRTSETFDLFCGSHDGYTRLDHPAIHRRWVFSLKSGFWFVRDVVESGGSHEVSVRWHLGPMLTRQSGSPLSFTAGNEDALAIVPAEVQGWKHRVGESVWSPAYGRTEPSLAVEFSAMTNTPSELACMLVTSNDALGTLYAVSHTHDGVHAYRYVMRDSDLLLVFASCRGAWTVGAVTSDADFMCVKQSKGCGGLMVFCNGSAASIDGRPLVRLGDSVPQYETIVGPEAVV